MRRSLKSGETRKHMLRVALLRIALPLTGAAYVAYRLLGAFQPEFADALP